VKRRTLIRIVSLALVLALPAAAMAGASVQNGSFEGDDTVGSFVTLSGGSTAIAGWSVSTGSVDWIGTYWSHHDGLKSLDLNGLAPGAVSQTLTTTANSSYLVAFWMAANPTCGAAIKTLDVSATGAATVGYQFDSSGRTRSNMGWTLHTYAFTAVGSATQLAFSSTTPGSCGPALDLVAITQSTTPTKADCKAGGWRSMADGYGNRFRNQGDCVSHFATNGRNPGAGTR
jgi:choice-of-anchor C domain-containing protein